MASTNVTRPSKQRRRAKAAHKLEAEARTEHREFPPGSIEAKIAAIGRCVPRQEWERIPGDYFARPEYYRFAPEAQRARPKKS
jgi:hypothetical protein